VCVHVCECVCVCVSLSAVLLDDYVHHVHLEPEI
jgi:hypothetical protein